MDQPTDTLRIDKWLWYARFFKTRSLSARVVTGGKLRVNQLIVKKASATVKIGDVLTFAQEKDIRVIKIIALGHRRGPANEAQDLYEDLAPIEAKPKIVENNPRFEGGGRPTSRERRAQRKVMGKD